MTVATRFTQLINNLTLTDSQATNGRTNRENVVRILNAEYRGVTHSTLNSLYVGSWGKHTRIRPPRDVDVLYILPSDVHERFERRSGNKQSQLLQEIKSKLGAHYGSTNVRGDGPVIVVPFATYTVELIPAFRFWWSSKYQIAMTDGGGRYKEADYDAEQTLISSSNQASNGNTIDLIKMLKCWQGYCSVPIKSFWLELLAVEFVGQWTHKGKTRIYYDWMVRDFFQYLVGRARGVLFAPGTYEMMSLGDAWKSRAESALSRAKKACDYESSSLDSLAGDEWQKIFGPDVPRTT